MSLSVRSGLALSIPLAIALAGAAWIASCTMTTIKNQNQVIVVKGYAEKNITSDLGAWTGSFAVQAPNIVSAYSSIETHREAVLAFLEKQGFSRNQVAVLPVVSTALYKISDKGKTTNEIEGYRLSQSFKLESSDVQKISRVSKEISELTKKGIAVHSYPPSYYYSKLNDSKLDLLAAATRNARERAEILATNSKGEVGAVRSASQGVFQITPRFSTNVSDYGSYDTSTIEKTIKSVVTVRYNLR